MPLPFANHRNGARWAGGVGLGEESVRALRPDVVYVDISGYGPDGPYRDKKAYDLLLQGETGLLSITGTDETPSKVGISIADIAGGMYAYTGLLTALLTRAQTGHGLAMEVSLFDALGEWMGAPAYYTAYGGTAPGRTGAAHATIAPYELFVSEDLYEALPLVRQVGLQCILSHQSLSQLERRDIDLTGIIWQCRSRLIFANDADDADRKS